MMSGISKWGKFEVRADENKMNEIYENWDL